MGSPRSKTNIDAGASVGRTEAVELYALGDVRLVGQDGDLTDSLGAKHMALLVYLFHERRVLAEQPEQPAGGRERRRRLY